MKEQQMPNHWKMYEETQRVKSVLFARPVTPEDAMRELASTWQMASSFPTGLAQVRAILPLSSHEALVESVSAMNDCTSNANVRVVGRLPFSVDGELFGIYYLHAESTDRPSYNPSNMSHEAAVANGRSRFASRRGQELHEGFRARAVELRNGVLTDIFTNEAISDIDVDNLVDELITLHSRSFQHAHDPAQRTREGVLDILSQNPNILVFNESGKVVSVGYLERDARFAFGGIALVEPTYFTDPDYNGNGLSLVGRRMTQELARNSSHLTSYGGAPMLVFCESIRYSSFPLAIGTGFDLGGDLGEAYTTIGPASHETGYVPMGVTYYVDPRLGIQDNNWHKA